MFPKLFIGKQSPEVGFGVFLLFYTDKQPFIFIF